MTMLALRLHCWRAPASAIFRRWCSLSCCATGALLRSCRDGTSPSLISGWSMWAIVTSHGPCACLRNSRLKWLRRFFLHFRPEGCQYVELTDALHRFNAVDTEHFPGLSTILGKPKRSCRGYSWIFSGGWQVLIPRRAYFECGSCSMRIIVHSIDGGTWQRAVFTSGWT
jgi:hypothetical protein